MLPFKHSKIRVALIIIYHRWMTVVGYDKLQTCKARESKGMQYCISATPYLQNRKHGQVRIKYKLINISYSYKYNFPVWY